MSAARETAPGCLDVRLRQPLARLPTARPAARISAEIFPYRTQVCVIPFVWRPKTKGPGRRPFFISRLWHRMV